MKSKSELEWARVYWIGTMLQIGLGVLIITVGNLICSSGKKNLGLVALIIGGTSSALWGSIIAVKSGRVTAYKEILRDFFKFKQPLQYYGLCFLFLLINFGSLIVTGKWIEGIKWWQFIIFFLVAIVFGGIEEIGWRYTFHPLLETKLSFISASLLTFISWGIWHYMYFYIVGNLPSSHMAFLVGLLGSCFILGAIFRVSHSLWLCVMYHALFNMFSQTLRPNSLQLTILFTSIGIAVALLIVCREENKSNDQSVSS